MAMAAVVWALAASAAAVTQFPKRGVGVGAVGGATLVEGAAAAVGAGGAASCVTTRLPWCGAADWTVAMLAMGG